MRLVVHKARSHAPHRIAFPDGESETVLRAAQTIADQHITRPVLLGRAEVILDKAARFGLELHDYDALDTDTAPMRQEYADALFRLRQRKGMAPQRAAALVRDPTIYGLMMAALGDADGFVGGLDKPYPETIRPALQIVGLREDVSRVSALHRLVLKDRLFFCADTMVNIEPSSEELAEIACLAADIINLTAITAVAADMYSRRSSVGSPQSESAVVSPPHQSAGHESASHRSAALVQVEAPTR